MKASKKGFSLVEIIVAISILALISVGIVGGFSLSQKLTISNALKDEKAAILQEACDILIAELNLATSEASFIDRATVKPHKYVNEDSVDDFDPGEDSVQFAYEKNYKDSGLFQITATLFFDTPEGRDNVEFTVLAFPEKF